MYGLGVAQSRPKVLGVLSPTATSLQPVNFQALAEKTSAELLSEAASRIYETGREVMLDLIKAVDENFEFSLTPEFTDLLSKVTPGGSIDILITGVQAKFVYKKLDSIRALADKWINEVHANWFYNKLQDAYATLDPARAAQVSNQFDLVVEWKGTVNDLMKKTSTMPEAQLVSAIAEFFSTLWEKLKEFFKWLKEIAVLLKRLLEALVVILEKAGEDFKWVLAIVGAGVVVAGIYLLS